MTEVLVVVMRVDRKGVKGFTGDGLTYMPVDEIPKPELRGVSIFARGGSAERGMGSRRANCVTSGRGPPRAVALANARRPRAGRGA